LASSTGVDGSSDSGVGRDRSEQGTVGEVGSELQGELEVDVLTISSDTSVESSIVAPPGVSQR